MESDKKTIAKSGILTNEITTYSVVEKTVEAFGGKDMLYLKSPRKQVRVLCRENEGLTDKMC